MTTDSRMRLTGGTVALVALIAVVAAAWAPAGAGAAAEVDSGAGSTAEIEVVVGDKALPFDVPPQIEHGRTLVPLRRVAEALETEVTWLAATQQVALLGHRKRIMVTIDSTEASVGSQTVALDVAPKIEAGRTLIPLRFLAEALDFEVEWNGEERRVLIDGDEISSQAVSSAILGGQPVVAFTPEEQDLLAHLIYAEAPTEPYVGMVAVGGVVINRVQTERFPDTIRDVIYQPGQFTVVDNGRINLEPNEAAIKAAEEALHGRDPSLGALYFFDPSRSNNAFLLSRPVTVIIGGHRFAR